MPTKKPVVQVVLEQDIFNKLQAICEKEERSASKKSSMIIREYIQNYEKQNGNINIGNIINQSGDNNTINIGTNP